MFARKGRYSAAYTHREPSRDEELRLLVEWATSLPGTGLLLVGPQVTSLENSDLASALVSTRRATYTTWKKKGWWRHPRVIALWPDERTLMALDGVSTIEVLGVLTWGLRDVKTWAAGVEATDLLGLVVPTSPVIQDPVVLGALRSLTNSVNLSTGLGHPSDWDHAVQMFRTLRRRAHQIDADEIEAWALANGWDYRHAGELGQLAGEIASGKAKRTKSKGASWVPTASTVSHWRKVGDDPDWRAF